MDSSTRISDLPDIGSRGFEGMQQQMPPAMGSSPNQNTNLGADSSTYIPMNVHPNPYGNQPPTSVFPPPQQTQSPPKLNSNSLMFPAEQPQMQSHSQPQYQLPSRDIPQDMSVFTVDEAIQPNYIPRPKREQYIEEDNDDEVLREHRKKEKRVRFVDDVFVDIQKPVILALLFLLFQLPFMNAFLNKYLFFLKLSGEDGNMTIWGMLFKSSLFGTLVYCLDYLMNVLSE
jgi:hypothetical protein